MNISYVNLIHWAYPMSIFLSFNERILNLLNEFFVDEFCYQKPIIQEWILNFLTQRHKVNCNDKWTNITKTITEIDKIFSKKSFFFIVFFALFFKNVGVFKIRPASNFMMLNAFVSTFRKVSGEIFFCIMVWTPLAWWGAERLRSSWHLILACG